MSELRLALGSVYRECSKSWCGVPKVDDKEGGLHTEADFGQRIRPETQILTGAVGIVTSPAQADHVIRTGQADVPIMAREFLRDPYSPLRAARDLGYAVPWPVQNLRGAPSGAKAGP